MSKELDEIKARLRQRAEIKEEVRIAGMERYYRPEYPEIVEEVLKTGFFPWKFTTSQAATSARHQFHAWRRARRDSKNPDQEAWKLYLVEASLGEYEGKPAILFKLKEGGDSFQEEMKRRGRKVEDMPVLGPPPEPLPAASPMERVELAVEERKTHQEEQRGVLERLGYLGGGIGGVTPPVVVGPPPEPSDEEKAWKALDRLHQDFLQKVYVVVADVGKVAVQRMGDKAEMERSFVALEETMATQQQALNAVITLVNMEKNPSKPALEYKPVFPEDIHRKKLEELRAEDQALTPKEWAYAMWKNSQANEPPANNP